MSTATSIHSLQATVDHVLDSARFKASPTLSRLLRYLAAHHDLAAAGRLNAYSIATDALDQPTEFDPQSNAMVRVYITRLRTLLSRHAAEEGRASGHALRLPAGSYRLELIDAGADGHAEALQPSIAILPLSNLSGDERQRLLCTGLSHEMLNLLSQTRQIRVLGADTVFRYRDRDIEPVVAGTELEVDYVLSGTLRTDAASLVITATLTDVLERRQVWAQRYPIALDHAAILEVQDELAASVCATLVSMGGVIDLAQRHKHSPAFSAYEAVLRFYEYQETYSPQMHAAVREALEQAVRIEPAYAEAWGCLSGIHINEYIFDFNRRDGYEDPLTRGAGAAKRALALEPGNLLARYALATGHFYRGEMTLFRAMTGEILDLAPNRIEIMAGLGLHLANGGDWEQGLALLDRARALNPLHPSWYWFPYVLDAYRRRDYSRALACANRLTMPEFFWESLYLAMIHGQLGTQADAHAALERCLAIRPDLASKAREIIARVIPQPELAEHCVEGLVKAGLTLAPARSD